jgi:hypothetical protein
MDNEAGAGTGGGGPSGGNTSQASAVDKRARIGDPVASATGAAVTSTAKTDLINAAIYELRAWFEKHFRGSNELSQDTQLHNAVHGAVQNIHGLLGERAG